MEHFFKGGQFLNLGIRGLCRIVTPPKFAVDFAARVSLKTHPPLFWAPQTIFNQALDVRPRLLQGIAHRGYI